MAPALVEHEHVVAAIPAQDLSVGTLTAAAPELFMLEDAVLDQVSGQVIESKGAYSSKEAVLVGPPGQEIVVELGSLLMWERLASCRSGPPSTPRKCPSVFPALLTSARLPDIPVEPSCVVTARPALPPKRMQIRAGSAAVTPARPAAPG